MKRYFGIVKEQHLKGIESEKNKKFPDAAKIINYKRTIEIVEDFLSLPDIVCLCGSTKFKNEFEEATRQESVKGKIVLSVCQFTHADNLPITEEEKHIFDELHLRKIDLANEILIINPNGYIGESTKKEIEYARQNQKIIRYMYEKDA